MVLLAGVVTLWKKYFGDNKLRKCRRTGYGDELRLNRPRYTLLDSIIKDMRTKIENIETAIESHNVLEIGSKKCPLYKGKDPKKRAVKINTQDVFSASLVAMIEDQGSTMNEKVADLEKTMNEKIADLNTKILTIRNDGKQKKREHS